MRRLIDGGAEKDIEAHEIEWGFGWTEPSGNFVVIDANDEAEARELAQRAGGKVVCREVFITAWGDAPN